MAAPARAALLTKAAAAQQAGAADARFRGRTGWRTDVKVKLRIAQDTGGNMICIIEVGPGVDACAPID